MIKIYRLLIFILIIPASLSAQWDTIPGGANKTVYALKVYKTGIAVGGEFTSIANSAIINLAYYEGSTTQTWSYGMRDNFNSSAQFTNVPGTYISSLEVFDDRLWLGGKYYHPFYFGNVNLGYMEYDSFSNDYDFKICYSHPNNEVGELKALGTKLYAGGSFTNFGGNYIASFNSGDYPSPIPSSVDSGFNGSVQALCEYNNTLYAAGGFSISGATSVKNIAKLSGGAWMPLGSGVNGTVTAMTVYNNELIVAGSFTNAGGVSVTNIAKWNGTSWSAMGSGLTGAGSPRIYALKVYNGKLYAGGDFQTSGSTSTKNIAVWNGSSWSAVGTGITGRVYALEVFENELWIGGNFTEANGLPAKNIVKYKSSGVGINESAASMIRFFPNPAYELINISNENGKAITVSVVNQLGVKMLEGTLPAGTTTIDVGHLPSGFYFIETRENNKVHFKRFMKL